jgi:hypothetical protein
VNPDPAIAAVSELVAGIQREANARIDELQRAFDAERAARITAETRLAAGRALNDQTPVLNAMSDLIVDVQREGDDLKARLDLMQRALDSERATRAGVEAQLVAERIAAAGLRGRLDALSAVPVEGPSPVFDASIRRSERGTMLGFRLKRMPSTDH